MMWAVVVRALGIAGAAFAAASAEPEAFNTTLRAHLPLSPCADVSATETLAFVARAERGCTIIDIRLTASRMVPSDPEGVFQLDTGSGTHEIEVSVPGYETRVDVLALADLGTVHRHYLMVPIALSAEEESDVAAVRLDATGPDPFRRATTFVAEIPAEWAGEPLVLAVFDIRARLLRTLRSGRAAPGSLRVVWDGRDAAGTAVAPGVYVARLSVGSETRARRIVSTR